MEPNILLIGKNIHTLEILKDELTKFDRKICFANSEELIESHLKNNKIDLIVVGAGLPNEIKNEMVSLIERIAPEIELHIMQKIAGMTPVSMIGYTNEKAIMWRMLRARKTQ